MDYEIVSNKKRIPYFRARIRSVFSNLKINYLWNKK